MAQADDNLDEELEAEAEVGDAPRQAVLRDLVDPDAAAGLSADLQSRYSRKLMGEVTLFAQIAIGVAALGAFLVYLVSMYIDVLFGIDFTAINWSYLNEFTRLFVILMVAIFNLHMIHQVFKFTGRRVKVMTTLREMGDVLEGEGETLWRLRAILWDEQNSDLVESERSFASLRDNLERAYKNAMDLREDLRTLVAAVNKKQDIGKFIPVIRGELKDCQRSLNILNFPYFMDANFSAGVRFYHYFRSQVREMLDEITRLMNQFENMAKLEDQRKLERERSKRLELERQQQLGQYTLESHLDTFLQRINELTSDRLKGKMHTKFLMLYTSLKGKFELAGLISPDRLEAIAEDVQRINQIEEIIAFYEEKIRAIKNDSLDLSERRDKARYWAELRDQHIAELRRKSAEQMVSRAP